MNTRPGSTNPDEAKVTPAGLREDDLFDDSDFWEGFVESVSVIARRRISLGNDMQSTRGHL